MDLPLIRGPGPIALRADLDENVHCMSRSKSSTGGDARRHEPPQLTRGREHDREQKEAWRQDALDIEFAARPGLETYDSGRRGYTDIRGRVGTGNDGLVVEVKSDYLD